MTIRGDGAVEYEGGEYVFLKGKHRGRIPMADVASLVDVFRRAALATGIFPGLQLTAV